MDEQMNKIGLPMGTSCRNSGILHRAAWIFMMWRHLRVSVVNHVLRVEVAGREALAMRVDRDVYSLFGVHVSQARARFRNLTVQEERPALATQQQPMTPAGGPTEAAVPANDAHRK